MKFYHKNPFLSLSLSLFLLKNPREKMKNVFNSSGVKSQLSLKRNENFFVTFSNWKRANSPWKLPKFSFSSLFHSRIFKSWETSTVLLMKSRHNFFLGQCFFVWMKKLFLFARLLDWLRWKNGKKMKEWEKDENK